MNPARVIKHLARALAGFLLLTMLAGAAGGLRGAMAAEPTTGLPPEKIRGPQNDASRMGFNARMSGLPQAPPSVLTPEGQRQFKEGWGDADKRFKKRGFKRGWDDYRAGRSEHRLGFMHRNYNAGWNIARNFARGAAVRAGRQAFKEGRSIEAPKRMPEDLRESYKNGWLRALGEQKAKEEKSKQGTRVGSYQGPTSGGGEGEESGWNIAINPQFIRHTSRNFLAAPLTFNNVNTGANLLDFNTNTNGVGGSLNLSYQFSDRISVFGINWSQKVTVGFQGSRGSTSTSLPLITVANPFNAVLPTIDGSQVFNLNNNIQDVQYDFTRKTIGGFVGYEAESPIDNATSFYLGARFGAEGTWDIGSLRFANGNVLNMLDSNLDYYGYGLEYRGGPVFHIDENIELSIIGNVGLVVLDSRFNGRQTVGNQTFAANDSDVKTTWSAGVKVAFKWRQPIEEIPFDFGAYFSAQFRGASPVVDFASGLGASTRIGYAGSSEFRVGVSLNYRF